MDLHERLVAARSHAGFERATDAARALGVSYPTYAGHENGSSGFRSETGELYARRFKVRFEWLMRGIGPMLPAEAGMEPPDSRLRGALLAYGVDRGQLDRLISIIDTFVPKDAEQSGQTHPDYRSQPANHRRESEPSRSKSRLPSA